MIERARITGVILAGGRGARMDHRDKGLELFRGEPLVAHALRRLAPQVASIVISANRHLDTYETFGRRVVSDRHEGHAGPMAGMSAALHACETDYAVTVPCDAPFFPLDLVARFAHAIHDDGGAAFACTTEREHPVFACVPKTLADAIDAFIGSGTRSMNAWLASVDALPVLFDDEAAFGNLNTIAELHDAEDRA